MDQVAGTSVDNTGKRRLEISKIALRKFTSLYGGGTNIQTSVKFRDFEELYLR